MGIIYQIQKDLRRDKIRKHYASKQRLIDPGTYHALKSRKKCMYCGKKFSGQIPEIHHKIPISKGGTNERMNLMAVHTKCHKILDERCGVIEHVEAEKN